MRELQKDLLLDLRLGKTLTLSQQLRLTVRLSMPAMLAQLSTILMQYIDASMVGQLGAADSASIGLVSSTLNLFNGMCGAAAVGFTIQVAQSIGAQEERTARDLVKQGFAVTLALTLLLLAVGVAISGQLPHWLGAEPAICAHASEYFFIASLSFPLIQLYNLSAGMLQATGDLKTPGLVMGAMGLMDILFNALLIFPTRQWGTLTIPGADLGVQGAALGTLLAELAAGLLLSWRLWKQSPMLHLRAGEGFHFHKEHLSRCVKLALPVAVERLLMTSAGVVVTKMVAPLGTVSIAADSFASTAESLCYMPAYGIQNAASTLVGQSIGARRGKSAYRFAMSTVGFSMTVIAATSAVLYAVAPIVIGMLSPDPQVVELGSRVLRIALLTEPFYGAFVTAMGVYQGAGDTLKPTVLNFLCMWGGRLPLIWILVGRFGLSGVWTARAAEMALRGGLFIIYLARKRWMPKDLPRDT